MIPITYTYIFICRGPGLGRDRLGYPFYWVQTRRTNENIAQIVWYPTWRRWVFQAQETAVWSSDCLADVQDYLKRLTDEGAPRPPNPEKGKEA